jgi:hypothetical protein
MLAAQSGCDNGRTYNRFRSHIDQRLLEVLEHQSDLLASVGSTRGEDCTRGAVIAVGRDLKPELGVGMAIEQQSWDALLRCWHRTIAVRFANGDRRIKFTAWGPDNKRRICSEKALVLLQNAEAMELVRLLQTRYPHNSSREERPKLHLSQGEQNGATPGTESRSLPM